MSRFLRLAILLLLSCVLTTSAAAELYTWVDEAGRMHMADDLGKVPERYQKQASDSRRDEIPKPRRWNEMERASAPPATPVRGTRADDEPRVHILAVARAGNELSVWAELDGAMRAPFIVDTGAMLNTVPQWVVDEMGITIDEDTPATYVTGISGQPMFVRIVTFASVNIGGAEVEDVDMAVLPTQRRGLLGMPFFNHFKVSTDPTRGILRLEEIDLDAVEGVYGGQNERAWRADFSFIDRQLATTEQRRSSIPSHFPEAHEQLDQIQAYWENQMEDLELKASRAGVPTAWRE